MVTKKVEDSIHDLFAVMATIAALTAVTKVRFGCIEEAEHFAKVTERWLKRAGSKATDRCYRRPSV